MIGASCVATGALLLWSSWLRHPWYHPDETIKTIADVRGPPLLCVVVAAFLGARFALRRLFVIASAASLILGYVSRHPASWIGHVGRIRRGGASTRETAIGPTRISQERCQCLPDGAS